MKRHAEEHRLLETRLLLRPQGEGPIASGGGQRFMAVFLDLVRDVDPEMAQTLHDSRGQKPFTVSYLLGDFPGEGAQEVLLDPEKEYALRVTTFDARLGEIWKKVVLPGVEGRRVRIGRESFLVMGFTLEEEPLAEIYRRHIIEGRGLSDRLVLHFHTPTSFRSGRSNFLFPLPRLVWLSLNKSWSMVAPVELGKDLHVWAEREIKVSRYELRTRILHFDRYRQVGFTGFCEYRLDPSDHERLRVYRLLADFSRYAGLGMKTTMGMGQVTCHM
ncbi:MAG: CRISPR-associated endoribonuclease Cas6 [Actinobacteria bacterium]|nr:CRISPR-associated endoribonuclease Cas6 [Actinomycetota bacterium]